MKLKTMWRAPKDLGRWGKELWKQAGGELVKAGSLEPMDRQTFLTMCICYDRMMAADAEMREDGLSVDSGTGPGIKKKHPSFAIWKTSMDGYMRLLGHFGLSPQSRGLKVKPKEEAKGNGKERFFKSVD
jgi:P27 family predicted phage terminase small subunit